MLYRAKLSWFILSILLTFYTHANDAVSSFPKGVCINNASDKNIALKKSFNQCWDPLGMDYLAYSEAIGKRNIFPETASEPMCSLDELASQKVDLEQLASALNAERIETIEEDKQPRINHLGFLPSTQVKPENKSDMINKECILASMKRNPGNKGYICEYPGDKKPKDVKPTRQVIAKYYGLASGPTAQCADSNMTDYVHFAVNSAIQCLSGLGKVDSKTIFRKINNESAFNVSVASNDGVGISQLTGIAIKEMVDPRLGRGRFVLEHVAHSTDSSCNGFKSIAAEDLKKAPSIGASNRCAWISPGDGLARNLIYSIGYYMTMRDRYIVPMLFRQAPSLIENHELLNDLASIAYGAEGIKHVRELLNRFRVNDKSDLALLKKKIRSSSRYLQSIKLKMKEMTCIKNGLNPSGKDCQRYQLTEDELEGKECVAPI